MPNNSFAFKHFTIKQNECAMKVGTDAVLLGAWVNATSSKRILDIGTGTGVIAIMLAQKSPAKIDAIDVDEMSYKQATENVGNCPWKEWIQVYHTSLQEFSKTHSNEYDLIVSNPPYFIDSTKTPTDSRTHARHADLLSYEELLTGILKLLSPTGSFCVILPNKEGEQFRDMAEKKQLHLTKLVRIHTRTDKTEKRLLMKFEFTQKSFSEESITIEKDERHTYTEEYKELTKDYYLNF